MYICTCIYYTGSDQIICTNIICGGRGDRMIPYVPACTYYSVEPCMYTYIACLDTTHQQLKKHFIFFKIIKLQLITILTNYYY